jgi:hypothetical protein
MQSLDEIYFRREELLQEMVSSSRELIKYRDLPRTVRQMEKSLAALDRVNKELDKAWKQRQRQSQSQQADTHQLL